MTIVIRPRPRIMMEAPILVPRTRYKYIFKTLYTVRQNNSRISLLVLYRFSFTYKLIKDFWQKEPNEVYTQENVLEISPHNLDLRVSTEYFG